MSIGNTELHTNQNIRVLLIDQEKQTRQIATTMLQFEGYNVVAVNNGIVASGQMKRNGIFDFILINVKESELTSQLIRTQNTAIPIVYYTEKNLRRSNKGFQEFPKCMYPLESDNQWGISELVS